MRMKAKFVALIVVALAVLVVAPVAAQDDVTLVVWDNYVRDAEQAMIETLHAQFEEAHPGVTIQRESYETGDLTTLLPRALSDAGGPDVAMINQGVANMGALVAAGLLMPLNDYADQYDWWSRYGMGLHARNSAVADGSRIGSGDLYGMSNIAEVVAIFYHKDIFEELGLSVPTTFDEFEAALVAIKDAGYVPITFGNLEAWPGIHTYGAILHSYSTPQQIDDLIFGNEGATFDFEGAHQSAAKFQEWIDAGFFSPGFEGMDNDVAALGEFTNKESAMWLAGSWNSGPIIDALGEEEVGFFLLPSAIGAEAPYTIGGVGLGYGIRATSANPDLAAEYIDLMTSSDAAALLFENDYMPAVAVDPSLLTEGTLTADLINAWNTISAGNAVGHYLDWTMPDAGPRIQELAGAVVTPDEFVANMEADYEALP